MYGSYTDAQNASIHGILLFMKGKSLQKLYRMSICASLKMILNLLINMEMIYRF